MKTKMNILIASIAFCSIGFISASAFAAQDELQHQITLKFQQAKQKLEQAKAVSGDERQTLLAEHMKLMDCCMRDMNAVKLSANMTKEQSEQWVKVCKNQMSTLLQQMKEESKLTVTNCEPKSK